MPHVNEFPALTSTNVPAGAVAWPTSFLPQHNTARLVCTPHVWAAPPVMLPTTCPIGSTELARSGPALARPSTATTVPTMAIAAAVTNTIDRRSQLAVPILVERTIGRTPDGGGYQSRCEISRCPSFGM